MQRRGQAQRWGQADQRHDRLEGPRVGQPWTDRGAARDHHDTSVRPHLNIARFTPNLLLFGRVGGK